MTTKNRITVYDCHGVLAHEYQSIYSLNKPSWEDCPAYTEMVIELPVPLWYGQGVYPGVTLDGTDYLLSEVLRGVKNEPYLCWYDGARHRRLKCEIIEVVS